MGEESLDYGLGVTGLWVMRSCIMVEELLDYG